MLPGVAPSAMLGSLFLWGPLQHGPLYYHLVAHLIATVLLKYITLNLDIVY